MNSPWPRRRDVQADLPGGLGSGGGGMRPGEANDRNQLRRNSTAESVLSTPWRAGIQTISVTAAYHARLKAAEGWEPARRGPPLTSPPVRQRVAAGRSPSRPARLTRLRAGASQHAGHQIEQARQPRQQHLDAHRENPRHANPRHSVRARRRGRRQRRQARDVLPATGPDRLLTSPRGGRCQPRRRAVWWSRRLGRWARGRRGRPGRPGPASAVPRRGGPPAPVRGAYITDPGTALPRRKAV